MTIANDLRERTALRYAGNCKCGKCQLVPRELIDRASARLSGLEQAALLFQCIDWDHPSEHDDALLETVRASFAKLLPVEVQS